MNGSKNRFVTIGLILSVSLMVSAVSVILASCYFSRLQFGLLNVICCEWIKQEPEAETIITGMLKEYTQKNKKPEADNDVLSGLGYRASDFSKSAHRPAAFFAAAGFIAGVLLFLIAICCQNRIKALRIRALTDYLEQVNTGHAAILSSTGEDDFSKLEDELYKTVTFLYQTKDAAVQARNGFAENLSNIAHQLKTPITAICLSVQTMKQNIAARPAGENACCAGGNAESNGSVSKYHLKQVEKQLLRLTRLEEALLTLSRIDAGTIRLQKNETDVFTLLVLAADNLYELFADSKTSVEIPELGEMTITADPEWTMEAVLNLMKNGMEHGGRMIRCSYAQNPLYTEILIWDDGDGFAKEDIPHLFERFYRGKNAAEGGIGIGLALSKEIIERQNGTIRAKNRPEGGALFEIRFYKNSICKSS